MNSKQRSLRNIIVMVSVHVAAIPAFWYFSWRNFALFAGLYLGTVVLGIDFCYHRLLAHRALKARRPVLLATAPFGVLALMGGPISFVATHRLHHIGSDTPDDPHNARESFWFSHWGWLFRRDPKLSNPELLQRVAADVAADPYLAFLERGSTQVALHLALMAGLFAFGGPGAVYWGMFLRIVFVYHLTFLTNSAGHTFGYRTFDLPDCSRNTWWIGALSGGEAWQNNHHAYPSVANLGHRWWETDMTFSFIRLLRALRLVSGVRVYCPVVEKVDELRHLEPARPRHDRSDDHLHGGGLARKQAR
ncbi:MAG: fatty acid desaturase [Deltaproteobacteria bacterium]|nr:fatty acid desaturase [Deltaproteobacteria bacterium]